MMEYLLTYLPYIIIGFILIFAGIDVCSFFKEGGVHHRSFKNDVVTLGILGTLIGIFLGLYEFDVDNITVSIPSLLDGMKLAFSTSIAGLFASVMLTIIQKLYPSPYSKSGNPISDKLSDQSRLLTEFLNEIKKTNETIIEQVKNHRIESKDELTKVRDSLDKTLKKLSEGATREIIEALEQVIKDFNKNLTEQFGENFKQLNEACLKLVEWQQRYIESIEKTEKILAQTTQSLSNTSQSISEIADRNKEFEEFCNNTSVSLQTMNTMLQNSTSIQNEIKTSIEALRNTTLDLDKIPETFESITNIMQENNTKTINSLEQTNTKLDSYITNSFESVKKLNTDMEVATKNLNDSLVSLTEQFGENYRGFLEQIERIMPK